MKVIDLVENYKGKVMFNVDADGESVVSFDKGEENAIKDNIMQSEVAKFTVSVSNTVPAKATIEITVKEIAQPETPANNEPASSDPEGGQPE